MAGPKWFIEPERPLSTRVGRDYAFFTAQPTEVPRQGTGSELHAEQIVTCAVSYHDLVFLSRHYQTAWQPEFFYLIHRRLHSDRRRSRKH